MQRPMRNPTPDEHRRMLRLALLQTSATRPTLRSVSGDELAAERPWHVRVVEENDAHVVTFDDRRGGEPLELARLTGEDAARRASILRRVVAQRVEDGCAADVAAILVAIDEAIAAGDDLDEP